ncbi:GMC family oxidoreductase [Roseateles amylovorans]|uniref:GMC family oxidoreductase N-terminal domain-containing protein n=1 Tax=Roseateles amylovorans TaxID=2978473 RepID=A0ABY6ATA5_9BURK|nr:GMC family oxidoreductase N-terminal domain-containing protein [Roseateles amylovorans]UXH76163.1 GMC family oxidoreductase N-terminal domain-containing protein [Roseateles amylovorans]
MAQTPNASIRRPLADDASDTHFDFIVCGAGTSGSVVAGRLAANPDVRVLLIEAGGDDDHPEVMEPGQWPLNLGSERDWNFSGTPNPHLNNRSIPLNMGRTLGGGSSINVMVWARGHQNDWEDFALASGNEAWSYQSVLKIYQRVEDYWGAPDPLRRGESGPVHVASAERPQPVAVALLEAARQIGIPTFDSPNGAMMEGRGGAAINDLIVKQGRRQSIYRAYVHPRRGQANLTVLTDTQVSRLVWSGKRVVGVDVVRQGRLERFTADREVILSLGAVNTPKVLMQSGIGPEAELARHGIPVIQHLPGVGANHQDHVSFAAIFEYERPQEVGHGGSEATLYWSSDSTMRLPDMFHCQVEFPVPSAENASLGVPEHGWTMFAGLAHPKSRGQVSLSGPEVTDAPIIQAGTLSHPDDLRCALDNIRLVQALGAQDAFKGLVKRESLPGQLSGAALENYVRNAAVTYWHQSCTAKMGLDDMSVVDGSLKVYGVEGLRIADASVMPHITSGNTMAPCVVIGERAVDEIRAAYGL